MGADVCASLAGAAAATAEQEAPAYCLPGCVHIQIGQVGPSACTSLPHAKAGGMLSFRALELAMSALAATYAVPTDAPVCKKRHSITITSTHASSLNHRPQLRLQVVAAAEDVERLASGDHTLAPLAGNGAEFQLHTLVRVTAVC